MILTINFSSTANNRIIQTTISQITKGYDNNYFQEKSFVKEYEKNSKNNKENRIGFLNSGWGAHILGADKEALKSLGIQSCQYTRNNTTLLTI